MFQKEWEVLLVDDDPDVLSVTKLAMKNFTVYGLPLKIHACSSKAEAVALLKTKGDFIPTIAVAFIDVVMETDHAGLELCQYIREHGNDMIQIYIRTGQPGVAPERAVIDQYNISGYFTKVELTEDKLYSLTKSAIRQFYWSAFASGTSTAMTYLVSASGSRQALSQTLQGILQAAFTDQGDKPVASYEVNCSYLNGDQLVAQVGLDQATALKLRDQLLQQPAQPLGQDGDSLYKDAENRVLIKIAPQPHKAEFYYLIGPTFNLPDFVIGHSYNSLSVISTLWQNSN
jgi:CheY-like chemotaxis protein